MPPNTPNAPMGISPEQYAQLQEYAQRTGEDVYPHVARSEMPEIGATNPLVYQAQMGGGQPGGMGSGGSMGGYGFQPVLPGSLQEKFEKLYTLNLDRALERAQKGPQGTLNPILDKVRSDFYTREIPSLMNYYTAQGAGLGSSSRIGALGAAGAGLNTNLADLRSRFDLLQQQNETNMLGNSPFIPTYNQGQGYGLQVPPKSGIGPIAADIIQTGLETAGDWLPGPLSGLAKLGSRIAGRFGRGSAANQQAQIPAAVPGTAAIDWLSQHQRQNYPTNAAPIDINPLGQQVQQPGAGTLLTPQALAQLQAISGGAASDFARTYKQPQQQQQRQSVYSRLFPELAQSAGIR